MLDLSFVISIKIRFQKLNAFFSKQFSLPKEKRSFFISKYLSYKKVALISRKKKEKIAILLVEKNSWKKNSHVCYVCTSCNASFSLKTVVKKVMDKEVIKIVKPFFITHLNLNHKANCLLKTKKQLQVNSLIHKVKERVENNPLLTINQIYESERRKGSPCKTKCSFKRG